MQVTIINNVNITSIVEVENESKLKPDCVIEDWIKRMLNADDVQVVNTKVFLHDGSMEEVEPDAAPVTDIPEEIPVYL